MNINELLNGRMEKGALQLTVFQTAKLFSEKKNKFLRDSRGNRKAWEKQSIRC